MRAGDHVWRDHAPGDVVIPARLQVVAAAALVMVAVVSFRAPGGAARVSEATLPYYDEATFTPHWTPVVHRIGPFALMAHTGRGFTDADVRGQVHVVSFLYTQCPNICPRLTASLQRVEERTRGTGLRLVSYTVTPDIDTPEVLAAFATRHRLPATWTLVTGTRAEIARLARERYFAMDDRSPDGAEGTPLLHSEKLLLVDRGGRLRGLYNGLQPADLEHLIEDAAQLTSR